MQVRESRRHPFYPLKPFSVDSSTGLLSPVVTFPHVAARWFTCDPPDGEIGDTTLYLTLFLSLIDVSVFSGGLPTEVTGGSLGNSMTCFRRLCLLNRMQNNNSSEHTTKNPPMLDNTATTAGEG